MAAFRQLSGTTSTLLELIQQGEIPEPELMGFNRWEQWRRDAGRRPLIRVDGQVTTSRQEAELWRATMQHFHGEN